MISGNGNSKIKVGTQGFGMELPIKCPDQATNNTIATFVAGGVVVLAGVALACHLFIEKVERGDIKPHLKKMTATVTYCRTRFRVNSVL